MDIQLIDVSASMTLSTTGPLVEFTLTDDGQANVVMMLSLDDGTLLHYPHGGAKGAPQSVTLAPRVYLGVLTIVAMELKHFGRSYDSRVRVGDKTLAVAQGDIPDAEQTDQHTQVFQLRVKAA